MSSSDYTALRKLKEIQKKQKIVETNLVPFDSDGWSEDSGTSLTYTKVQRDSNNGRPFSNLYSSFNLPTTSGQITTYNEKKKFTAIMCKLFY